MKNQAFPCARCKYLFWLYFLFIFVNMGVEVFYDRKSFRSFMQRLVDVICPMRSLVCIVVAMDIFVHRILGWWRSLQFLVFLSLSDLSQVLVDIFPTYLCVSQVYKARWDLTSLEFCSVQGLDYLAELQLGFQECSFVARMLLLSWGKSQIQQAQLCLSSGMKWCSCGSAGCNRVRWAGGCSIQHQ